MLSILSLPEFCPLVRGQEREEHPTNHLKPSPYYLSLSLEKKNVNIRNMLAKRQRLYYYAIFPTSKSSLALGNYLNERKILT